VTTGTATPQRSPRTTEPDRQLRDAVARRLRDDAEIVEGRADRAVLRRAVARALAAEGVVAAPEVWARLVRDLVDELGGLGPLEALLRDPTVTDVMVNGADDVHVERADAWSRRPSASTTTSTSCGRWPARSARSVSGSTARTRSPTRCCPAACACTRSCRRWPTGRS
jgi:hypothetical protein